MVRNGNQKGHKRFRELRRTPYIKCLVHICTLYLKKRADARKRYTAMVPRHKGVHMKTS